jgi:alkylation response protein AidB-like acyl-CoA dehydrogenase
MAQYSAPVKDMQFVLHDVLQITCLDIPGYRELDASVTRAVLEEAGTFAQDVLAPLNGVGDREGCSFHDGQVRTPTGFKAAFDAFRAGGWPGLDCDPAFGGQGLQYLMGTAVGEIFVGANMAFNMYPGLTHGAYSAIHAHGTPKQRAEYLPRLVSCEWTGTMNLTEPHCGTDLGQLRTRAEPQPDGSYRISGTKIFISAGDHDLACNIIHLVLAKVPGGGEGTKGISLFIVPKRLLNADGSAGATNAVSAGRIEQKMGIHGNATCEMHYDGATGFLLGDLHKGMRAMFTMMNEARIGVGVQGYAVAEAAYQNAATYARDRLQGRAADRPVNALGAADPLIVHPDIRRSLMDQKSFVEGARALTFWGASLIDQAAHGDVAAEALISLLTPVIKGFQTDKGFEMTVAAQQIYGGHGYVEANGMSQFVRDARVAMIYEGANGVQALDLVGRKLAMDGGAQLSRFLAMIRAECGKHKDDPRMVDFAKPLMAAGENLQAAATYFMQTGTKNPNAALAGSTDFLHLMGHVCLGLMWTRMAAAAFVALDRAPSDMSFYQTKVATGRYYMARQLPACALHLARIKTGADPVMALTSEQF